MYLHITPFQASNLIPRLVTFLRLHKAKTLQTCYQVSTPQLHVYFGTLDLVARLVSHSQILLKRETRVGFSKVN